MSIRRFKTFLLLTVLSFSNLLLSACSTDQTGVTVIAPAVVSVTPSAASQSAGPTNTTTSAAVKSSDIPSTTTLSAKVIAPTITSTPSLRQEWQYNWLKGIPCPPPCWEGITPGITTLDEAIKILKQNPQINLSSIEIGNPSKVDPRTGDFYWEFVNDTTNSTGSYDAKISAHPVISIYPHYTAQIKLGEIIQSYGPPSYVRADATADIFSIYFVWLSQGFEIGTTAYLSKGENIPKISAELSLGGKGGEPLFFGFKRLEELAQMSSTDPKLYISWQGYKDFYFYCRYHGTDNIPCTHK